MFVHGARSAKGIYMFKHTNILMVHMYRRTTVLLEKDVYDALVRESIDKYNSSKAISKVLNEILKGALYNKNRIHELLHSKRVVKISNKEFEEFRHEMSQSVWR